MTIARTTNNRRHMARWMYNASRKKKQSEYSERGGGAAGVTDAQSGEGKGREGKGDVRSCAVSACNDSTISPSNEDK